MTKNPCIFQKTMYSLNPRDRKPFYYLNRSDAPRERYVVCIISLGNNFALFLCAKKY